MKNKRKYIATLRVLKKTSPEVRREIIKYAPQSLINVFSQAANDILNDKYKSNKKFVDKYRKTLTELRSNKNNCKHKKKILVQKGSGFIRDLLEGSVKGLVRLFKRP